MEGGGIKLKHKFQNSKIKKGFTLIEMVVVMSIISIIMLVSASALFSARENAVLDAAAEEFLATIREAQNRSVSVEEGAVGQDTKGWGVKINTSPSSFTLVSLNGTAVADEKSSNENFSKLTGVSSVPTATDSWIIYSSPFGTAGIDLDNSINLVPSGKPSKEYSVVGDEFLNYETITYILEYRGKTTSVVIRRNGDAYIQ